MTMRAPLHISLWISLNTHPLTHPRETSEFVSPALVCPPIFSMVLSPALPSCMLLRMKGFPLAFFFYDPLFCSDLCPMPPEFPPAHW